MPVSRAPLPVELTDDDGDDDLDDGDGDNGVDDEDSGSSASQASSEDDMVVVAPVSRVSSARGSATTAGRRRVMAAARPTRVTRKAVDLILTSWLVGMAWPNLFGRSATQGEGADVFGERGGG